MGDDIKIREIGLDKIEIQLTEEQKRRRDEESDPKRQRSWIGLRS